MNTPPNLRMLGSNCHPLLPTEFLNHRVSDSKNQFGIVREFDSFQDTRDAQECQEKFGQGRRDTVALR